MGKWIVSLICTGLLVSSANAAEMFFFDYDATIYHPKKFDKSAPGIYDTKLRLFKIKHRPNLLVQVPDGPDMIEVSSSDIRHKLTRINEITEVEELLLSPSEGRIGFLEKVVLSDGTVVIPGLYRMILPETFKYFRESPSGENYLLESFKKSEELEAKKIGTFRGPFWNHMVNLLDHPDSAKQFGIITARGHSLREWKEFFDYLLEHGYIKNLPQIKNIHNMSRPEYEKYGMKGDDTERKVGLLKDIASSMLTKKHMSSDFRLHPNGKEAGYFHVLSFVDDNQRTLEFAYEEMRNFATRRTKIKIILSNSGLDHEVKKSRKPRSFVITSDGTARAATEYEVSGEPIHQNEKKFVGAKNSVKLNQVIRSCSYIFN